MAAQLLDGPTRVPLPLSLPRAQGGFTAATYAVELRVADCALARQQEAETLAVEVGDQDSETAEPLSEYDLGLRSELLSAACP